MLLVQVATLGLAVLAMAVLQLRVGQLVALPMIVVFGLVSALALVLTGQCVLAVGPAERQSERKSVAWSTSESETR
ncbi:hypothetical protein [Halogranum amylolyticum]|uniref:hypothetical protein n=1 Tax=Halogranum amylolyticum TaxID=660520 RepID=UPI001114F062|nr:hypothetical protein [Halogranum amylolyticum]